MSDASAITASPHGVRCARDYINLFEAEALGKRPIIIFVLFNPFDLAMPEAFGLANHRDGRHEVVVAGGTPVGHRRNGKRRAVPGATYRIAGVRDQFFKPPATRKIDVSSPRSAPGVVSALIGMGPTGHHVAANLKPAQVAPTARRSGLGCSGARTLTGRRKAALF